MIKVFNAQFSNAWAESLVTFYTCGEMFPNKGFMFIGISIWSNLWVSCMSHYVCENDWIFQNKKERQKLERKNKRKKKRKKVRKKEKWNTNYRKKDKWKKERKIKARKIEREKERKKERRKKE